MHGHHIENEHTSATTMAMGGPPRLAGAGTVARGMLLTKTGIVWREISCISAPPWYVEDPNRRLPLTACPQIHPKKVSCPSRCFRQSDAKIERGTGRHFGPFTAACSENLPPPAVCTLLCWLMTMTGPHPSHLHRFHTSSFDNAVAPPMTAGIHPTLHHDDLLQGRTADLEEDMVLYLLTYLWIN